jgi:PAS domain-containing protein
VDELGARSAGAARRPRQLDRRELPGDLARFGGDGTGLQASLRRALDSGEVTHEELRRTDELGVRDHYLTVIPIRGPDGKPQELMVMIQDITNLEVLRRAEGAAAHGGLECAGGDVRLDARGVFTMSEGRGLEALGLRPGEVVGQSAFEVYAEVPEIVDHIGRALAGEALTEVVEMGRLVFETRYTPLRDDAGRVTGMIGVATDFSDRKRLEDQLRQSQKMEAIGRLAGGVAHDFNNLLAAILGHTELMLERVQPGDSHYAQVEQIQKAGVRRRCSRAAAVVQPQQVIALRCSISTRSLPRWTNCCAAGSARTSSS